jgi:hypothetical protein
VQLESAGPIMSTATRIPCARECGEMQPRAVASHRIPLWRRTRNARHDKLLKVANIERGCLFAHGGKTSVVGGVLIETPE